MPRKCSVFGCRSNYDGEEYTTTFSLPKDPELRTKWLRKIPTDFSGIKNPAVCIKHFTDDCIIKKDIVMYKGELKEYERERPKYTEDAVPTIFPSCPSYLNNTTPKRRTLVDAEEENFQTAVKESLETLKSYNVEQAVTSLTDVINWLEKKKKKLSNDWIYYQLNDKLYVCLMGSDDDRSFVLGNICINSKLCVTVYLDKCKVQKNLPLKSSNLKTINEFENLINYVVNHVTKDVSTCDFDFALDVLKSSKQYEESESIQFSTEQIVLSQIPKQGRRYGNQTMILASCLFTFSPSAYNALLKSGLLLLPHPRNLRKLICHFDLSMSSLSNSADYLKSRVKYLQPQELIVNLILDEIYIHPQLSFKGGQIHGNSLNNITEVAKTVQVFMISSVFSNYKDVVILIPVSNMNSNFLKELILSLISLLEEIGFEVLTLISDNNNVNRRAFELMSSKGILESCISHPLDPSRTLFFVFDTVHILKCIRNNWINKKNENRSMKYINIETGEILTAQYRLLELMYDLEKTSLLKFGHTLSAKALYPSNIQRQNVGLALKIFNENNIVALKHIAKQHPNIFHSVESTCTFIEIIVNWWKIVNVKSSFEGKRFNDKFRESVLRDSDFQVNFLSSLLIWLKNWKVSVPIADALTAQTFSALITTTESFLKLIPYIFNRYDVNYIILGKFQSDDLESRFSSYRQLSGANYYITYMQVLENERKIRFKNTVLFSLKHKNIPLKTLLPINEDECINFPDENINVFTDVVETEFNFESIPKSIVPIFVVIGGYSVRKVLNKKQCSLCISWLQLDKTIDIDDEIYEFLKDKDRGKLIMPTEIVVYAVGITWDVMNNLIKHSEFYNIQNHLYVLHKISSIKLGRSDDVMSFEECLCKDTLLQKLEAICYTISKIFLNNYTKEINDSQAASASHNTAKKIKKLRS